MRPGPKWLPAIIIERLGPLTYLVDVNGNSWKRHIDHLRIRTDAQSLSVTVESDEVQVSPMMSSPELPASSDSAVPTNEVESPQTADNNSTEPAISDTPEDATTSETVRRYPTIVRKAPERYQPAPN